eukprot:875736-Amphidinium_carterae.1
MVEHCPRKRQCHEYFEINWRTVDDAACDDILPVGRLVRRGINTSPISPRLFAAAERRDHSNHCNKFVLGSLQPLGLTLAKAFETCTHAVSPKNGQGKMASSSIGNIFSYLPFVKLFQFESSCSNKTFFPPPDSVLN